MSEFTKSEVLEQLKRDWAEGAIDADVLLELAYDAGAGEIAQPLIEAMLNKINKLQ